MGSTDSFCSGKFCQHQQASHCDLPFCLSLYQLHMLPRRPALYLIELVKTYLSAAQRADLGGQGSAGRPSAARHSWGPQKSPRPVLPQIKGSHCWVTEFLNNSHTSSCINSTFVFIWIPQALLSCGYVVALKTVRETRCISVCLGELLIPWVYLFIDTLIHTSV